MSSSSAGAPPASEAQPQQQQQQPQPSTSAANTALNVQVSNQGPGGAMMSPHAGPSSQPDNRYAYHPYGGKPMHPTMQRPMAPQQWLPPHGPDGTSDAMPLSQPPPSNYPGQQQGYPPINMYNNPQLPPSSGNNGYWMPPPQQQQQQQQPRYPMHQQQYPPGYGPPPVPHQAYGYPPMQHPGDWGRMPQMQYPQTSQQPMQPLPISGPPQQTLPPPPPPQQQQQQQQLPPPQAPITSQPSSSNIAAVAQALQSPGAASIGGHDETGDDTKSIRSTSSVPPPHTPARTPAATPSASATPGTSKAEKAEKAEKGSGTPASAKHAPPPTREEIMEKLCHTNDQIGPELAMQRRQFFETILSMSEKAEKPEDRLIGPPQVSKSPIDLHKLYIKVKEKGGFEQVTKDKVWKNLCVHANPDMSESSAAGYQLRRHYQKHLLRLECFETGRNIEELIAVAEKQKKKKKEKDPEASAKAKQEAAAVAAAAAAVPPPPPAVAQQQPPPPPPPQQQTLQPPPPPQAYSQPPPHPHGVPPPPPGQPGPSYVVDANGQPIQAYGQPGPYGYGGPPGWGAPPPHGYPLYPQQPRYPHHMMLPPGQQPGQQQQMQMPPQQQQHGMPPGVPPGMPAQQQQQQPSTAQPQHPQHQQQQPARPPMDQASFEEHQRQMIQQQQQQQRPNSRAMSNAATPQPPPQCSTAPGTSEQQPQQQQQPQPSKPQTPAAQQPPAAASTPATSQAAPTVSAPPPPPTSSQPPTSTSSAGAMPQTSVASSSSEAGNASALSNQLGQPPPMGMYGPPPQHHSMQMYPRMPYPPQQHQGMPNGYPQQPPQPGAEQQGPQQQQHPGMYPPHPSQQQMYGQQQLPQGWNQQMMRPPMPPQGYPGQVPPGQQPQQQQLPPGQGPPPQPLQPGQQPGQSSADFWQQQHQQRAAMAAAAQQQQQQQQQGSQQGQKKPPYFPGNQPPPQASPQPSQRHQPQQQQHATPNAASASMPPQPKMLPPQSTPQPGPSHQQQQQQTPQMSMHHRQQHQQQQMHSMPGPSSQPHQHQHQHPFLQQHLQPPIKFPPNSVEAIAEQHLGPQRRPMKKYTKDLIGAIPRRIMMALKSNIHMENVWALNALTVMLYDDSINPPTLSPEILNIFIEHFRASLSLVFPKAFPLNEASESPTTTDSDIAAETTFWEKVLADAEKIGQTIKTKVKLPPAMKNSLGKDLNSISRGGIKIISKEAEMPTKLKEWKLPTKSTTNMVEKKKEEMNYEERRQLGLPTEISQKIAESTKEFVEQSSVKSESLKFSKWINSSLKHFEYDDDVQPKELTNIEAEIDLDEEYYDHEAPLDCSLVPRPIGMFLIPDTIQSYVQLCLSWSNLIRGFSFNPVNELHLVNHHGLLRLIGRLLMLYVEKNNAAQLSRRRKQELEEREEKPTESKKKTTPEEDAAAKVEDEKKRSAIVSTEKDDMRSYLLDVANQLRDDAFTILSFISGSIDLFDLDSEISYPIFDALIHWTVSHSVLSKDPLVPWGIICPRDFCLEIIAKMSVIDHNVDLLLSTGSWKRIEEFARIVSDLLHMGEDTPIREFALVIMSALCQASESVCVIAALETNIVKNVISFMEAVDTKMHEVVLTKGMNELKNNPECIGTSIGMLRRAALLLGYIVQYEACRKPFLKYMNNLINLTISHYMDTRAAIQIASIVHMAQLSNIDSVSGKCLDVPDTPSVEPEILFPNQLPKFPKRDSDSNKEGSGEKQVVKKEASESGSTETIKLTVPKMNGIKRPFDDIDTIPSTSTSESEIIVENGAGNIQQQLNGIHNGSNGNGTHENPSTTITKTPPRINGIHKHKESPSPKQDVKAILRNSINHKQEVASGPTASKRAKLEVANGTSPTNGRINGTSPSSTNSTSNGPTTTSTTSSSPSSMAIFT